MKLLNVKEIAAKWKISERSVRNYCQLGRVKGAILKAKTWYIPEDATMPERKNSIFSKSNNILNSLLKEQRVKLSGRIYHLTQIDFAYNSNHIEGSRLTHEQTRYIFETHTIGFEKNKSTRVDDVIETINHFRCFDHLLKTINIPLDESLIKSFHRILKSNTTDADRGWFKVGDYKIQPNVVGGMKTTPPEHVPVEIKHLLDWYNSIKQKNLKDILEFHVRFEKIHPFQDGNGRVGRLIMFRECLKNDIVPFIIKDEVRDFYYRGIKNWNKQKGYLTDTCLKCQDDYKTVLDYLKIKY